jgi:hypothetical protein
MAIPPTDCLLLKMKTKNTACYWRDTATLPSKKDWSFDRRKSARLARKKTQEAKKLLVKKVTNSTVPNTAGITLESLGLNFSAVAVRQPTIVG